MQRFINNEFIVVDSFYPISYDSLEVKHFRKIEQYLKKLNEAGWVIEGKLYVASDRSDYEIFVDTSNRVRTTKTNEADYNKLLKVWGTNLHVMKEKGRDVAEDKFVYGSFYRPLSRMWARKIPDNATLQHTDHRRPHTYIITETPLTEDVSYSYELTLMYAPW